MAKSSIHCKPSAIAWALHISSTQLSLLPPAACPRLPAKWVLSRKRSGICSLMQLLFFFLHTQTFYWLQGVNKWEQRGRGAEKGTIYTSWRLQRVKLRVQHTYLLWHKCYLLIVVKNERSEWREFLWRETGWGMCLNFLPGEQAGPQLNQRQNTFQTLKLPLPSSGQTFPTMGSIGFGENKQFWEDKWRVHHIKLSPRYWKWTIQFLLNGFGDE